VEACGIFPDQGSNPGLLHWGWLFTTEPQGKPFSSCLHVGVHLFRTICQQRFFLHCVAFAPLLDVVGWTCVELFLASLFCWPICLFFPISTLSSLLYLYKKSLSWVVFSRFVLLLWCCIGCSGSLTSSPRKPHSTAKKTSSWKKWANDLNRHLSKKEIQMTNKHTKRCSTSWIREMPVKTTISYHLTPMRTATRKMSENNQCCRGCRQTGALAQWWPAGKRYGGSSKK